MIKAYYHIYLSEDKTWIPLFLDQLKTFRDSSLDEKTDILHLNVVGREQEFEILLGLLNYHSNFFRCKITCSLYNKKNTDEDFRNFNNQKDEKFITETVTLQKIWEDCHNSSEPIKVLYFHAKGVTSLKRHLDKNDKDFGYNVLVNYYYWRKFLDWALIENSQACIDILDNGDYDIVGVNYTNWPSPHFSGNYWLAKSEYIKKLSQPMNSDWWPNYRIENNFPGFFSDRIKDEMWALSGKPKHYSFYDHKNPPPKSTLAETLILRNEYTK